MLHGSDGDAADWPDAFGHAPDRPGHGDVPGTGGFEDQVAHFLSQIEPGTIIVAHSWSAPLALELARRAPDRVSKLVLLAPWAEPGVDPPPLALRLASLVGSRIAFVALGTPGLKRALVAHYVGRAFFPAPLPGAYRDHALRHWQNTPAKVAAFLRENLDAVDLLYVLKERRSGIETPTILLAGEFDQTVHRRHAEALARDLPNVELRWLADTGHMVAQTRSQAVLDAIEGKSADDRAERQAAQYGWNPVSAQVLGEGFLRWHHEAGFVAYVKRGRYRIAAGPPIASETLLAEVAVAFEKASDGHHLRVVWFAGTDRLRRALPHHSAVPIGATPWWNPQTWTPPRTVRQQANRARNKGIEISEGATAAEATAVRAEWLAARTFPALGFLTRPPDPRRLGFRRIFSARVDGRLVAYALLAPVPLRHGWLIEALVRGADAVNGTAEALVAAISGTLKAEGAEYATLGLAPLSTRGDPKGTPNAVADRLLAVVRERAAPLYDFAGLEAFKAKFAPEAWEPAYLLTNRPTVSYLDLLAVTRAFTDEPILAILRRWMRSRHPSQERMNVVPTPLSARGQTPSRVANSPK